MPAAAMSGPQAVPAIPDDCSRSRLAFVDPQCDAPPYLEPEAEEDHMNMHTGDLDDAEASVSDSTFCGRMERLGDEESCFYIGDGCDVGTQCYESKSNTYIMQSRLGQKSEAEVLEPALGHRDCEDSLKMQVHLDKLDGLAENLAQANMQQSTDVARNQVLVAKLEGLAEVFQVVPNGLSRTPTTAGSPDAVFDGKALTAWLF